MARVLITGGGGQIGSDLLPLIARAGHDYRVVDRLGPEDCTGFGTLERFFGEDQAWKGRWIQADASDPAAFGALVREFKPEITFHLVAILSATGEANPKLCWDVNVGSLIILIEELSRFAEGSVLPRIVCPSSVAAFGPLPGVGGGYPAGAVPNEFPMLPTTMYGVTKVAGELLGSYHSSKKRVDFRGLRYPGLLNASPPGGGSSDYANMMYFAAAAGEPSVEVFVRANARMPFMYMPDALKALLGLAYADAAALTRRNYNVASFSPSAEEIAASIQRFVPGFTVRYRPDAVRQPIVDSWPDAMNDDAARQDWGWKPSYQLDDMTAELLQILRADAGSAAGPSDTHGQIAT